MKNTRTVEVRELLAAMPPSESIAVGNFLDALAGGRPPTGIPVIPVLHDDDRSSMKAPSEIIKRLKQVEGGTRKSVFYTCFWIDNDGTAVALLSALHAERGAATTVFLNTGEGWRLAAHDEARTRWGSLSNRMQLFESMQECAKSSNKAFLELKAYVKEILK